MPRLLHDRFLPSHPDRATDLATGEAIDLSALAPPEQSPDQSLRAFTEVLDHGREGSPRWIVTDVPVRNAVRSTIDAAAREACRRGFVAIAADLYMRLRVALSDELRERTLLLIAAPAVSPHVARAALADAATRSSRPHVLLTVRLPSAAGAGGGCVVREARAAYGASPARRAPTPPVSSDVAKHLQRAARAADFARAGRHAAAERLLRDVIGALARRRALLPAATTGVELGRHLLERGRAAAADEAFAAAVAHAEDAADERLATIARVWQAAARTDAGQLTAAESLCRAVLAAGAADLDVRIRAEATLARVLLWQGRTDEATRLSMVERGPADEAFVDATAVRVLMEAGEIFAAGQRARHVVLATQVSPDPVARVIGIAAHLRVLLATGDLHLAEVRMQELRTAARAARTPLRLARISLLHVDALRRAGRGREAETVLRNLERLRAAAPALLREAIERRLRDGAAVAPRPSRGLVAPRVGTSLVLIAQREGGDGEAVSRLLDFTLGLVRCGRIDVWSADAGPATRILSAGTGLATALGERVLDSGITIGPEAKEGGCEIGVPIRLGERLIAALVARWPADTAPAADAVDVLHLTAAVAAPRIVCLLSTAREQARAATVIPDLIGTSRGIADVRQAVARAAASPFAVLIDGESGAGKELVARAIHQLSPRRERRFCDVNCAALPDDLIDAELFGHSRGAFTGAVAERAGLIEEGDGGTLFLDEVLDLSPRAQAKLLRVVQQQEVRRVGETFTRKVDVRLVSAANRDIRAEAAAGRFRHDLLYRLDVIRIHLPPLRERPEDIPMLAEHFWRAAAQRVGTAATLGHAVLAALSRYHWPGNVRELQNVIAALAVAAPPRGQVRPAVLPPVVTGAAAVTAGRLADARTQFERRFIEVALARAGGNRSQAAREIGLSRQGLLKLMARLKIDT